MSGSRFLLTRVVIENYKSIAACDVRLGPLTFLVGPNGAGKSNFLDALAFVADALNNSLGDALRRRAGLPGLRHRPAPKGSGVSIRLEFELPSGNQGSYGFRLGLDEGINGHSRWRVVEEKGGVSSREGRDLMVFQAGDGKVDASFAPQGLVATDRLYLLRASDFDPFREVYDCLRDMHRYQLQPQTVPDIEEFDPQQRLRPDGSNLASAVAVLQAVDPETKERIGEFLRVVLPTLIKVSAEPVVIASQGDDARAVPLSTQLSGSDKIALVFQQRIAKTVALFGPNQMSEGTLRSLATLVALYQMDMARHRPALVAIEDVEAAIHPSELAVFLDALEEASLSTQVLVTTHSSDLLDKRDVPLDQVLVVSAEAGVTRIGTLDSAARSLVNDRLSSVGELLRAGQIRGDASPPAASFPGHSGQEVGRQ